MPLRPVIPGARLPEHEVIRPENLPERPGSEGVHRSGLQIHEDGARDVLAAAGFVVIDVDPLELEIWVAAVLAGGVDGVLAADYFPELSTDLVPALASLDVKDLSHSQQVFSLVGVALSFSREYLATPLCVNWWNDWGVLKTKELLNVVVIGYI